MRVGLLLVAFVACHPARDVRRVALPGPSSAERAPHADAASAPVVRVARLERVIAGVRFRAEAALGDDGSRWDVSFALHLSSADGEVHRLDYPNLRIPARRSRRG